MPPIPPARGFQRYEFRTGVGEFVGWGGMMRDADPGSLPPNRPRIVVNGLFRNGGIESRPGQMLLNQIALGDLDAFDDGQPILTLADFQIIQAIKLWIVVDGCPGQDPPATAGFGILHYDQEQEPELQRAVYYDDLALCASLATYSGGLYAGLDDHFVRLSRVGVPWGLEGFDATAGGMHTPIKRFEGAIKVMYAFDGRLYLGLPTRIVAWDGTTAAPDLTGLSSPPLGMGTWREYLLVGFGPGPGNIRRRAVGNPPGTWTTISAPGVSFIGTGYAYKDKFYFTDGSKVWVYDGSTLTVATSPAGATHMTLAVAFGYLFYGYASGASHGVIGRFDGSTWSDTHKDLTAQPGLSNIIRVRSICLYRNDLYACILSTVGAGSNTSWMRSDKADTAGDWVNTPIGGLADGMGDCNQMLVF
jgi:hypothetical protein